MKSAWVVRKRDDGLSSTDGILMGRLGISSSVESACFDWLYHWGANFGYIGGKPA